MRVPMMRASIRRGVAPVSARQSTIRAAAAVPVLPAPALDNKENIMAAGPIVMGFIGFAIWVILVSIYFLVQDYKAWRVKRSK